MPGTKHELAVRSALEAVLRSDRLARRAPFVGFAVSLVTFVTFVVAADLPSNGVLVVALLASAASLLGVFFAGQQLRRLIEAVGAMAQVARSDSETGLAAPHTMWGELRDRMAEARQASEPLSVVMVSLDEIQALHLERGLGAGQQLLRQVARALSSTAQAHGGKAYRAHGNALVAILPRTSHAAAERVARKVNSPLALLARKNGGLVRLVAASAVALPGDQPEDVVHRSEVRCARLRRGLGSEPALVLRPLSH